jgi:hypothetical protein
MSMQPGLFLRNTDRIITGYGFKKSIPVGEWLKASDGTALTSTTTNVGRGAIETNFNGIIGNASGTFAMNLDFRVPWDYDQSIDKMKLRFLAQMSGTTNTAVKLDASVYQKKVNTALGTDLDPTISAAIPNSTTKADWVEILLDGKGLIAGSGLSWVITSSGTHTTDAIWIYSAEIEYFSDLVYFNRDIRRS